MAHDPHGPRSAEFEGIAERGIRVRAAREAARLTIVELAERTGISVLRLGAFEAGRAGPRIAEAEALSVATGVPAELFIEQS